MAKKEEWFFQCRLEKEIPETNAVQHMVSWIPENVAIPGAKVRLKQDDGTWTENWKVINRGKVKLSRKKVSDLAHGAKNFKENTDI